MVTTIAFALAGSITNHHNAADVASKTGGLQRPTMDRDNIHQRFGFPVLR